MIPVRKILCPVDTSDFSKRAVQHAVALGTWYEAEVTVLYVRAVVVTPALWFGAPPVLPPEAEGREEAVTAIRQFVNAATGDASFSILVTDGPIVDEILRVAGELPADLLVMGTHGLSGFERLLLGSITEKTLRKAPCPVLTVPRLAAEQPEPPHVTFDTIVCGVDRSAASQRALRYALSLAQEAGGRLVLVHTIEDMSEEEPRYAGHFNTPECWSRIAPEIRADYEQLVPADARLWCDLEVVVPYGKPYREILAVATARGADLIVVGAAGSTMPFGTTTQHVLRQARCPVLAVPAATGTARPSGVQAE
jgi:nucleotide-binding universal stress UspA family protein